MKINNLIVKCINDHYKFNGIKQITDVEHKLLKVSKELQHTYKIDWYVKQTLMNDITSVIIAVDKVDRVDKYTRK